jgi:hypothetical protein
MTLSPILLLHICAGTLGVLSGGAAMTFRKGSSRHSLTGQIFGVSMLTMSASGVYMAFVKSQPGNIAGGVLTFYLVATAWITARRASGKTGILDWGAFLIVLALAALTVTYGLEAAISPTGLKYGFPAGPYFFLGSIALMAVAGDVRLLLRGGISGRQRIARHLWRMCFALFIASASVFLARQQIFPAVLRKTGVLLLLSFLPLLLMIFWLIKIRGKKARPSKVLPSSGRLRELPT